MDGPAGTGLSDDTYVAVPPAAVAAVVADPARWRAWWPDLALTLTRDRGPEGLQWDVAGAAIGTAEIWLEAVGDGTVLHLYLRLPMTARARRRRALAWKHVVHRLKDDLERRSRT